MHLKPVSKQVWRCTCRLKLSKCGGGGDCDLVSMIWTWRPSMWKLGYELVACEQVCLGMFQTVFKQL